MPAVFADLLARNGDAPALVDLRRARTWRDLDQELDRAVHALAPFGSGARVAVLAENSGDAVLAHLALFCAGASTVPVNVHLTIEEVAYVLRDSDAAAIIAGPETVGVATAAARRSGVGSVIGWRCDEHPGVISWERILGQAAGAGAAPVDVRLRPPLLYTSGTTGRPKGVEVPERVLGEVRSIVDHVGAMRERNPMATIGPHLVAGPLYHAGPLLAFRLLAAGMTTVVPGRFDARRTLAAIEQHRIASTVMVPTHFVRLLALPEEERRAADVSSLRWVLHTGAPCPVAVKRQMIDWFGPVLVEGYGASEVSGVTSITSSEWLAHPGSVGRPNPGFETVVVDEHGTELPPRAEGRLYFRDLSGRGIVYHNDPEKSRAAHLAPGVFTLGEMGWVDEDGYVYISDRFSDMIVAGGVNIYPAEIEAALLQHPAIVDVAVVGVPDDDLGERPHAIVVAEPDADAIADDELVAWCRDRIAGFKVPRSYEWADGLDRDSMGKLDKRALRRPYWPSERTIGG